MISLAGRSKTLSAISRMTSFGLVNRRHRLTWIAQPNATVCQGQNMQNSSSEP